MNDITVGFALCGSFCTFDKVIKEIEFLIKKNFNVIPIMSYEASGTDTRFGKATDFINKLERITNNKVIKTISDAEPIGPKKLLDILIVAPCTGNTLGKLANGIFDTPVTLSVKSHLRNQRPVLIGVSTNDALGASAKNIGILMNVKNIFFVPMSQDDCKTKPNSIVAEFDYIYDSMLYALKKEQIQPIYKSRD
ncbi:MAG: dipicolinate synthase subunit B [Clostridia bacterium]|nr:dipicolinate synthase subunit B [Clostridia bacterium]